MNDADPAIGTGPDLPTLFRIFRPVEPLPEYEIIPADQVPQPYHGLLVHEHHMTVTVEGFHGDLVDVQILERKHQGDYYARKILLRLQKSGKVVLYGVVRVNLSFVSPQVRAEILAGQTPFGRILINHGVLRRIEPTAFLRLMPSPTMMNWLEMQERVPIYGRLALIHCDGKPAVELLEIVAP